MRFAKRGARRRACVCCGSMTTIPSPPPPCCKKKTRKRRSKLETARVRMNKFAFTFCLVLILLSRARAQHGSAADGYYPFGYAGDTWSGEVTSTNDDTREITLTYNKGSKTETFTGVLQVGYKVKLKDGTSHEL